MWEPYRNRTCTNTHDSRFDNGHLILQHKIVLIELHKKAMNPSRVTNAGGSPGAHTVPPVWHDQCPVKWLFTVSSVFNGFWSRALILCRQLQPFLFLHVSLSPHDAQVSAVHRQQHHGAREDLITHISDALPAQHDGSVKIAHALQRCLHLHLQDAFFIVFAHLHYIYRTSIRCI